MAGKLYPGQRPPDWQPPEGSVGQGGVRWWQVVLIVLGVLIVIGMFAPPPKEGAESASAVSEIAAAPLPEERKVTSVELARAYDANEVSAQQFATAGPLQVTGRVEAIELDFKDDPVVQLQGKDDYSHVAVYFDDDASDTAATLSKGQQLTVICSDVSEVIGYPQLRDCVLPAE